MKVDILDRRVRDIRQPKKDANYYLQERDIRWLSFLHRHGGKLPTTYLYDYTRDTHRCKFYAQQRLKELFQELKVLDRPWQQFEVRDSRSNELVHEISDKGIDELKERGLYFEHAPRMGGHFKHQLYLSCVSASIELNAREAGYTFIPQHEIAKKMEFLTSHGLCVPDEIIGLDIDGKQIILFVEIDRSTEGNRHEKSVKGKRWEKSLAQYDEIIQGKLYKDQLGVTCGALLLVVTVSKDKQEKILGLVKEKHPQGCSYVLTHYFPEFGKLFHPPLKLNILGAPWQRSGYGTFKFMK